LLVGSGLTSIVDLVAPHLDSVPDDSTVTFRGMDTRISTEHMTAYFDVAVTIGDAIQADSGRLTAMAGACAGAASLSASCVDDLLAHFGRRAFRRPLTADEAQSFRALNDGKRSPAEAIRAMVVTLLISPRFLNHLEIEGTPVQGQDGVLDLSPYEIAARLSYTFWQTLPDDALLDAAADGSLATDDGYARQLERVFADPRTEQTLWQFWREWLRLESFTGFSSDRPAFKALAAGEHIGEPGHDHYGDMVQEIRDLTDHYTFGQKGTLNDLLTSDLSFTRSADLAHLYGVPAWSGAGDYPRFPDGTRVGILQRGALLVSSLEETNPFHRGALVRRSILCDQLERPDPNTLPAGSLDPPPPSITDTTRVRYQKKIANNPVCASCHGRFSDIGYVLESFDALGRYRTVEKILDEQTGALLAELPIDNVATPRIDPSDNAPVHGPAELNRRIVESGKVANCLSTNYFEFTLRRSPAPSSGDTCLTSALGTYLTTPGVTLLDAFKAVAKHPSFRQRRIGAP
jgi:hypothetical protein